MFFENVISEYLKDVASKKALLLKVSRCIVQTRVEEIKPEPVYEDESYESDLF